MYLSRVALDTRRMETTRALAKPAILHGAIEQCFKGERKRRLWRIDQLMDTCYLLVLSEDYPDFTVLSEQFCAPNEKSPWETKSYSSFLEQINTNQTWRFRICANPVHSVTSREANERGKIYAHITKEHQKEWLIARSEKNGFSLCTSSFDVISSEWVQFNKSSERHRAISILTAVFEGILTVTDADCFRKTLINGIGRAKAYGCGLLTAMRP